MDGKDFPYLFFNGREASKVMIYNVENIKAYWYKNDVNYLLLLYESTFVTLIYFDVHCKE